MNEIWQQLSRKSLCFFFLPKHTALEISFFFYLNLTENFGFLIFTIYWFFFNYSTIPIIFFIGPISNSSYMYSTLEFWDNERSMTPLIILILFLCDNLLFELLGLLGRKLLANNVKCTGLPSIGTNIDMCN